MLEKARFKSLTDLVADQRLVVCVGTGGVGKTTTAAALGVQAARMGRRVLVVTIDPARRLANALGLDSIGSTESQVDAALLESDGTPCEGSLHAMMLDTRTAFDEIMAQLVTDPAALQRILDNHIYRQVSNAVSTSQEFIASEKLYSVYTTGRYDLIVLDTPPMKNALDFFEAPQRMVHFLDDKIIKWFVKPVGATGAAASVTARLFSSTSMLAYKLLGYIFGNEFLLELNEFFVIFKELTKGFYQRSEGIARILRAETTSFMIVCSAASASLGDVKHFSAELRDRHLSDDALVVNQVQSYLFSPESDTAVLSDEEHADLKAALGTEHEALLGELEANYRSFYAKSMRNASVIEQLKKGLSRHEIFALVPRMREEVHDLQGLMRINRHLFSTSS